MTESTHLIDERLDDWLDGRLPKADRLAVERHLASCEPCRRRRDALELVQRSVRSLEVEDEPPREVLARVGLALDAVDAGRSAGSTEAAEWERSVPAVASRWPRLASAAALVLALVVAAVFLLRSLSDSGDLVHAVMARHRQLGEGPLTASLAAPAAGVVEERWRLATLDFPARVLDLQAMGIVLEGGDVTELDGHRAARTIYRFQGSGERLLCAMFLGTLSELPTAEDVIESGGFVFHVYRVGDRTAVFWAEGELLCVLVGRGEPREILELAQAKAMAPSRPGGV